MSDESAAEVKEAQGYLQGEGVGHNATAWTLAGSDLTWPCSITKPRKLTEGG